MKTLVKYASIAAAFAPLLTFAAVTNPTGYGVGTVVSGGPQDINQVWTIVQSIMNWVVAVFFLFATFQFIMAGWAYLKSEGSEETTTQIRKQITFGVIGVAVGLLAFALPKIVQTFLGVNVG